MHKAVTALYRTRAVADQVRDALVDAGVSRTHIDVIPDRADDVTSGGHRDDDVLDEVHDLHLPEEDIRTYQNAVRRGDYVVSVEIDDENVGRVSEIMRNPEYEAYDLDATDTEFTAAEYHPPRATVGDGSIGRREVVPGPANTRTYGYDLSLEERRRLSEQRRG